MRPQFRPEEDESSIKDFNLTILHVNDIGSHLRGESISLGTSMHDGISAVNDAIVHLGGFPRIVKAMDQVLENTELNVLKLHAGDALIGTKYFSGFRGKADADMMNRICFHAFVPGNEDFTEGFPSFLRNDLFGQTSLCQDTRVVCANLEIGHGSPMEDLVLSGHISSSRIVDFRSNHKVGIVGITGKKKAQMRWLGRNTTVLDERQAAENEIEYLTSIGVDKIVLLTHIGFENDLRWMLELEGVDIIVGGDSRSFLGNTELESDTDPLLKDILSDEGRYDGKYPTTRLNSAGKLVCIVQAWEHAKAFGKLDVTFDADGNLKSCGGRTVVPFQVDESVPADLRIQIASNLEGLGDAFFETQEDDATAAALAFYDEKLKNFRIIARVRFPGICLERIPGEGKHTVICTSEQTASQGGGVGNLVAQAYLHEIGADIALQNAGGIRSDLYHGNFSNLDANTLLPFSNALIALGIKGHQIKTFLEEAIEQALQTEGDGAYPYCAGLRFVVYEGGGPYNRISQLEVNRRLGEGTWSLVDPNTTYTIVTNAYLADGNDGYDEFRNVPENVRVDTGTFDTEAFISFAESRGILTDPPSDTYSTQQFIRETMAPTSVAPATVAPVTASPSAEDVS